MMITTTPGISWQATAATVLVCLLPALPCTAQPLVCPQPHGAAGAGMLKETPAQIAEIGSYLADDGGANQARVVVADLRARYPGVGNAEVEDFLVTAYCPVVARLDGLSLPERKARLDRFALQVRTVVFGR